MCSTYLFRSASILAGRSKVMFGRRTRLCEDVDTAATAVGVDTTVEGREVFVNGSGVAGGGLVVAAERGRRRA